MKRGRMFRCRRSCCRGWPRQMAALMEKLFFLFVLLCWWESLPGVLRHRQTSMRTWKNCAVDATKTFCLWLCLLSLLLEVLQSPLSALLPSSGWHGSSHTAANHAFAGMRSVGGCGYGHRRFRRLADCWCSSCCCCRTHRTGRNFEVSLYCNLGWLDFFACVCCVYLCSLTLFCASYCAV